MMPRASASVAKRIPPRLELVTKDAMQEQNKKNWDVQENESVPKREPD